MFPLLRLRFPRDISNNRMNFPGAVANVMAHGMFWKERSRYSLDDPVVLLERIQLIAPVQQKKSVLYPLVKRNWRSNRSFMPDER